MCCLTMRPYLYGAMVGGSVAFKTTHIWRTDVMSIECFRCQKHKPAATLAAMPGCGYLTWSLTYWQSSQPTGMDNYHTMQKYVCIRLDCWLPGRPLPYHIVSDNTGINYYMILKKVILWYEVFMYHNDHVIIIMPSPTNIIGPLASRTPCDRMRKHYSV